MIKKYNLSEITIEEILKRSDTDEREIEATVAEIIDNVRKNGDKALLEYALKFDKASLNSLSVTKQEIDDAFCAADDYFIDTLRMAAENIERFHKAQLHEGFELKNENGSIMGQRYTPLHSAGLYVPGGTASYPSTVLMAAIPAKIAGVTQIIMVSPPGKNGKIAPEILVAAKISGVDKIYKTGGAGAVAALCYGTESIPRVDKIVGPGNAYVACAKRMVYGTVDIDMIAGPSDILVLADESANARYVAADMLSQAEHDIMAAAVLITTSKSLAQETEAELQKQLALLSRRDIAAQSLAKNGKIIIAQSIEQAVEAANATAPEHLEICCKEPFEVIKNVKNAGSVFLGNYTPEPLGDYFAGPNHTLPTNGTARFSSPLSTDDFVKKSSYLFYTKQALQEVSARVADFANREGLTAHARSITVRQEEN